MEEDLNLFRMKMRIITKCWFDMTTFPKIKHIAIATGLPDRTIFTLARQANLPKRTKLNIQNHLNNQL